MKNDSYFLSQASIDFLNIIVGFSRVGYVGKTLLENLSIFRACLTHTCLLCVIEYFIEVKIPPEISPYPVDKTNIVLIDGEDALFRCDITAGDPEPEVRWYINEELVEIDTPVVELTPVV